MRGERFFAADVMLGSSVVHLRQFGMLPDASVVEACAERCLERPSHRRALEFGAG
jgi:glutathione S-transferase